MSQFLHLEMVPDEIALITFDNLQSKVNVLSPGMWAELHNAIYPLAAQEEVRGLILQSSKPGIFIAGADLKELSEADPNRPEFVQKFIDAGNNVLRLLERLPFPTIALLDGAALGGGLEVALACDYRWCGTNPRLELGLPEVKLGLIPGWGGTQRLPRLVDPEIALARLLSGESFRGTDLPVGTLVNGVVESGQLLRTAVKQIQRTNETTEWQILRAKKSQPPAFRWPSMELNTPAARALFHVVTEGCQRQLDEGIALETEAFLQLAGSQESRRLIAEFFASRKK